MGELLDQRRHPCGMAELRHVSRDQHFQMRVRYECRDGPGVLDRDHGIVVTLDHQRGNV